MISTVERGVGKPMLLSGSMVNPLAQFVGQPGDDGADLLLVVVVDHLGVAVGRGDEGDVGVVGDDGAACIRAEVQEARLPERGGVGGHVGHHLDTDALGAHHADVVGAHGHLHHEHHQDGREDHDGTVLILAEAPDGAEGSFGEHQNTTSEMSWSPLGPTEAVTVA
jgi:hypothetical protein